MCFGDVMEQLVLNASYETDGIMDYRKDEQILHPPLYNDTEFLGTLSYDSETEPYLYEQFQLYDGYRPILYNILLILASILPVIFFIAIARVAAQKTTYRICANSFQRYLIEFVIIILPTVMIVIVLNEYIYVVNIIFGLFVFYALYKIYKTKTQRRWYIVGGRRPFVITLVRATIYLLTSICILSEHFVIFPSFYEITYEHKTKDIWTVNIKDAIIGFYVFSMAVVERNSRKWHGLQQTTTPLIILALLRFISIKYFDYTQDETEHGEHWNVFVTLILTKCIGCFYCYILKSRFAQLFTGIGFLLFHQVALHFFTNTIIMDQHAPRHNFISANREDFLSLPGFIGLYLISVYIGRCLRMSKVVLNYHEILHKLKCFGLSCLGFWVFSLICAYAISISRVSCNLGYVLWILAMALTLIFVFMIVFHLVINTLWFIDENYTYSEIYYESILNANHIPSYEDTLPVLVEAINRRGCLFFVLTIFGARVNKIFNRLEVNDMYVFVLICNALLFATGIISLLHHFKIRILRFKY